MLSWEVGFLADGKGNPHRFPLEMLRQQSAMPMQNLFPLSRLSCLAQLGIVAVGLVTLLLETSAHAQCCRPGTLMQWSCGNSFSGGPDLSSPLVTDRPDFTEASSTVGLGVAQLEFGYTYTYNDDAGVVTKANSYGEPLLRFGVLADWLEMRVGWNYATEEVGGVKSSGSEDLYLGFKIGLTPQEGLLPEMALIPQMTVPSGANAFTSDEVLGGVNWIYGWELNDWLSTAGSTQFNRAVDETSADAYTEWAQSWTVAMSLSDQLGRLHGMVWFLPAQC